MNTAVSKTATCMALAAILALVPGCWDYQRINYRAQVMGIAVDPDENDPNMLHYTFQVPRLDTSGGQTSSAKGTSESSPLTKYTNFAVSAPSIDDALSRAQQQSNKSMFLGSLEVLLLNRKLKGGDVQLVVSELMRNPNVDHLAFALMTPKSGEEIFSAPTSSTPSETLSRFLEGGVEQQGYMPRTHLWELWRDELDVGKDATAGVTDIVDGKLAVGGVVLFQGSNPVLDLNLPESFAYNVINGTVKEMRMSFSSPNGLIALGDIQCKASQSVVEQGRRGLKIVVHTKMRGVLLQEPSRGRSMVTAKDIRQYEQTISEQVAKQALSLIEKVQQAGVDPWGFGSRMAIKHPEEKELIRRNWSEMFRTATPQVEVDVTVTKKGTLM